MKIDPRELLAVFIGGIVGTLARVGIAQLWPAADAAFPWAVFVINITGAFLLGYLVAHLQWRASVDVPSGREGRSQAGILSKHGGLTAFPYARQLMGTGFCGAYTTFSTMQLELLHMVDAKRYGLACVYLLLSVVCGYCAVYTATALNRRVRLSS